jgi:serine/threonine protein kinase
LISVRLAMKPTSSRPTCNPVHTALLRLSWVITTALRLTFGAWAALLLNSGLAVCCLSTTVYPPCLPVFKALSDLSLPNSCRNVPWHQSFCPEAESHLASAKVLKMRARFFCSRKMLSCSFSAIFSACVTPHPSPKKTSLAARLASPEPLFLDFVSKMLIINPDERLSASQVRASPPLARTSCYFMSTRLFAVAATSFST